MAEAYDFEIEDVEYARPDGAPLLARLYRPRGAGPFPGVVEVHGGAWTTNDRMTNVHMHEALARAGVVVMALDFRMPPSAKYPASITDIHAGVRWFKAHAADLKVAAGKVGLLGTSSGGHQAMLTALRPGARPYGTAPVDGAADLDATVGYIVICWAIVDPLARYRMVQGNGNQRLVDAHDAYWPSESEMADANPQLILERGEAASPPAALYLQGGRDDNVTPDMADRFAAAYKAAGGAIALETFPEAPHAFVARDPESADARRALTLIRNFVLAEAAKL